MFPNHKHLTLWGLLGLIACTSLFAEPQPQARFTEARLPKGALRGLISVGDRCGAVIAGGTTVYSNDTFTITVRGHKTTWQVLQVTDKAARFAQAVSNTRPPLSTPPDCTPNLADLMMLLERHARLYNAASTRVLKDQAMATAKAAAQAWCSSNQTLCIKGKLSDLTMIDGAAATVRLTDLDYGRFSAVRAPNLSVSTPFKTKIMITRAAALSHTAGDAVLLCGRPHFLPEGAALPKGGDAPAQQNPITSFRVLSDSSPIGTLDLTEITYDIYDPKAESVQ